MDTTKYFTFFLNLFLWLNWLYVFSTSFRLSSKAWGLFRFLFIIVNNLYCIPTHCLWMLMLWPLQWVSPKTYLTLEGIGFQWLLSMVSAWSYTAGYNGNIHTMGIIISHWYIFFFLLLVVEMGDEVQRIANDKSLMLINHQSTSDVPLIMAALDGHTRKIMWIMDRMFMKTNFGIVSWFHKDFFISSVICIAFE